MPVPAFNPEVLLDLAKTFKLADGEMPALLVLDAPEFVAENPPPDVGDGEAIVGWAVIPWPWPTDDMPRMLAQLREGPLKGHPVRAAGFISDAYYYVGDEVSAKRGSLAERFEAGDMSVKEALQACTVSAWGAAFETETYHRDDDGEIVFDGPVELPETAPVQGLVPDALRVLLK